MIKKEKDLKKYENVDYDVNDAHFPMTATMKKKLEILKKCIPPFKGLHAEEEKDGNVKIGLVAKVKKGVFTNRSDLIWLTKDAILVECPLLLLKKYSKEMKITCKCNVFVAPCTCGRFRQDMIAMGKRYNKYTKLWEPKKTRS